MSADPMNRERDADLDALRVHVSHMGPEEQLYQLLDMAKELCREARDERGVYNQMAVEEKVKRDAAERDLAEARAAVAEIQSAGLALLRDVAAWGGAIDVMIEAKNPDDALAECRAIGKRVNEWEERLRALASGAGTAPCEHEWVRCEPVGPIATAYEMCSKCFATRGAGPASGEGESLVEQRLRAGLEVALEWPDMELRHLIQETLNAHPAPSICGIVSMSGPNGEPLACGYTQGHDGPHSWSTLPTWAASGETLALSREEALTMLDEFPGDTRGDGTYDDAPATAALRARVAAWLERERGGNLVTEHRRPAECFPPGDFLGEEMAERGLDIEWLCQTIHCDDYGALSLLKGERPLNAMDAARLGRALGTGPEFWMNLQASWDSWREREPAP